MRAIGFHFRRQAPLLGFYLDFVCFKHRLVVEVDGSHHSEDAQAAHDAMRDAILRRAGFRTLRFWNFEITTDLDGVVRTIELALTPPSPSWGGTAEAKPRQGGGVGSVNEPCRQLKANPHGRRISPDSPTLTASRPSLPMKGRGV